MVEIDFMRQASFFNPKDQKFEFIIIGAGSTGSFITLNLAKMGFSRISAYDFDKVEPHNIPNQFYRTQDINKPKVESLYLIVKEFTGVEIIPVNEEVTKDTKFNIGLNTIFILCLDSLAVRKLVFNLIKDFPITLIDTRMGGEGYSIQVVNLESDEDKEEYTKTLETKALDLPCGQKAIIYNILSLASETVNIIKKMHQNQPYPKILRREMATYRIINNEKV